MDFLSGSFLIVSALKSPEIIMDKRKKAYMYPVTNRNKSGIYNPYIDNFIISTGNFIEYVNAEFPSDSGIFNLFRFIRKIDYLFLNWIEDLPEKKGGIIQSVVFLALLRVMKLFNIKVIWTLHNKTSHSSQKLFFKNLLFSSMLKRSDVIITHSREGINVAESLRPGVGSRIFYFPHPIVPFDSSINGLPEKKFDILIWGSVAPYKAIDVFLKFLSDNNSINKYKILIAGKAVSAEFLRTLKVYESENLTIRDEFIENEELALLIHQSRAVLFTYAGDSVLSSGALIDSISHRASVIGPDVGAFAELGEAGIIKTYNNLEELQALLDQIDKWDNTVSAGKTNDFIKAHTWEEFSKALETRLSGR